MRTTALLIIAALAWITWFISALWLEEHLQQQAPVQTHYHNKGDR